MTDDAWRPIESAPKDGTEFLVYMPTKTKKVRAAIMTFDGVLDEWVFDMIDAYEVPGHEGAPTHWRPHPPPPQEGEP